MVCPSTLCNTCRETLNSPLAENSWRHHHGVLESLQEAVLHRCFICSIVWKKAGERQRAEWTDGSGPWQPMRCRVYREESEESLVKLEIVYLDTVSNQSTDVRFRLIPTEGQLCFRFVSNFFCAIFGSYGLIRCRQT